MTTTFPTRLADLLAHLCQLVLFPDLLGVDSVPLASCQQVALPAEWEPQQRPLTYQQALQAGQLPLFDR
jgi:hypothetical protein